MSVVEAAPDAALAWDPPAEVTPRGTVVVLPGRGEHGGVYERFGRRLAVDGYRVRALGQAPTSASAARDAVAEVLTADLPRPYVVAGSDSGAVHALAVAAGGGVDGGVDGAVVAGYPVGPGYRPDSLDAEIDARTSCPVHAGRLRADPRFAAAALDTPVTTPDAPVTTPDAPVTAPDAAAAGADEVPVPAVPVLAVHGADDVVSPYPAARAVLAGVPDLVLVTLAGGRHDAFNDRSHRTVAAHVVLFLEDLRGGGAVATSERLA